MKTLLKIALFAVTTLVSVFTHAQINDSNFYACNNGYATCNQTLLSEEQKQKVYTAALSRNFYACNNGYATCNQTLLSEEQRSRVYESTLSRNFNACNNGYVTCNQTLLSEEQRQRLVAKTTNNNSSNIGATQRSEPQNPYPNGGGACAENGSCYGDISTITGAPKTNHINGYYRSNGTYVRGHYRSR